jgi:hypothetical protein
VLAEPGEDQEVSGDSPVPGRQTVGHPCGKELSLVLSTGSLIAGPP